MRERERESERESGGGMSSKGQRGKGREGGKSQHTSQKSLQQHILINDTPHSNRQMSPDYTHL